MTARWAALTPYSTGTVILPTVDNGRCFYASVGGTSGASEPTWPGRYPGVADASVTWVPYTVITPQTLRDVNGWTASTPAVYGDTVLGNHLLDSADELAKACKRHFLNRPGITMTSTSMLRAILPLYGLRTATTVVYGGTTLTSTAYWLLPDAQNSGVYTGIGFRALRANDASEWWLADPLWFDKALDSPFYPGNYGGGYVFSSMPNDTAITGDWGYAPGQEPNPFVHALEVLASFESERRLSLLADSAITPAGGVLTYSQMPAEVRQFVADWAAGQQVVSIG